MRRRRRTSDDALLRSLASPVRLAPAGGVSIDHVALVPASLLPAKAQWQALADGLPAGEALLIVPTAETPFKRTFRGLVPQLRARGRHVTVVPAERFDLPCGARIRR